MNIAYDILFSVTTRHTYFTNGVSGDFSFVPSPSSLGAMSQAGLMFRETPGGFSMVCRVKNPGGNPPELFNSLEQKSLRLSFLMYLNSAYFQNYSILPGYEPGKDVFYLSNLRDDQSGGHKFLGDQVSNARLGNAVELSAGSFWDFRFQAPVQKATLVMTDVFGNNMTPLPELDLPAGESTDVIQLDWRKVKKMAPGRYQITATTPGGTESRDVVYEPGVSADRLFGIVELFSDTLSFTNANLVPATYRFLNNNQLTRINNQPIANYSIGFSRRALHWQYVVVDRLSNALINLNNLSINGFTAPAPSGGRRIFRSNAALDMEELSTLREIIISNSTIKIPLPVPASNQVLKKDSNGVFFFEMFVYVS
ncbi:MAG: hypothetical protein IT270_06860 [Saprospiraceae bacterium]|nr:hypothetical protein [Saprospiraceae bacterium]